MGDKDFATKIKKHMFVFIIVISILLLLIVAAIFIFIYAITNTYYCEMEKKHCAEKGKHIGCNGGAFLQDPTCENLKLVPLDDKLKNLILSLHNTYRNEIGVGFDEHNKHNTTHQIILPKASQMREIKWDIELQILAELHAVRCNFSHDECRSTDRFEHAGQNIAYMRSAVVNQDYEYHIKKNLEQWYQEIFLIKDTDIIKSYALGSDNGIGHYLQMVEDRVDKMGCGYVTYDRLEKWKGKMLRYYYNFITCDYSLTNMEEEPVYEVGDPGSGCREHGMNSSMIYPFLCTSS